MRGALASDFAIVQKSPRVNPLFYRPMSMGFRLQTLALAGAAGAISLSFNFAA
jgi:hypothetical protein